ncbi:malto-oligosyltrehalose synthase [Jannaschia sp. 2305UL9-9]|uniref:malto-oligosyltrehalose synthase n=1 Tax=Jannaschia sp. 2305UL9-9 TaxID=3121638 RepID=UPI003527B03C
MRIPTATYRLQLRDGVDFDAAIAFLPHLTDMGISDLYLSPIFTAAPGSTHGYDVTDPSQIDPVLGGRDGFDRLATAAQAAGIGLIIDIVPNHTAFCLDNPWLMDVLRHGRNSAYCGHFDIHWDEGALILPWLTAPFEALLTDGKVHATEDTMVIDGLSLPLRADDDGDRSDLAALHDRQVWRAVHWQRERDGVTHRRFFNVTGLIGMRVGQQPVFDDMHALTIDLVRNGQVQGIRIDHIDGLRDPAAYLDRLRAALPETPIWVEKILTGDETLPEWPVEGTTGYEAATMIARVLTDAEGAATLTDRWRQRTGAPETFHAMLQTAKGHVIRRDLASELRRLILLARRACDARARIDPGDEALREAIIALLMAFPRYRTYFSNRAARPEDIALMRDVAGVAARDLRAPDEVDLLARMITHPDTWEERAFRNRFQQVTGAHLAKSHEDTAGFRWTPVLATCEVGADPDHPTADAGDLQAWARAQPGTGLLLTSSHDTKRSEDARMRLIAWTHLPHDALTLLEGTAALPQAGDVPADVQWYLVQAALAIWGTGDGLADRLCDHMTKALREADQITSWTHPDAVAEARVMDLARAVMAAWDASAPPALPRLIARGAVLSMCQLALKLSLPGIPDIYRGCEGTHFALTDPDNRLPVDLGALRALDAEGGLAGAKRRLLGELLTIRARHPNLFTRGATQVTASDGTLTVRRSDGDRSLSVTLHPHADDPQDAVSVSCA